MRFELSQLIQISVDATIETCRPTRDLGDVVEQVASQGMSCVRLALVFELAMGICRV